MELSMLDSTLLGEEARRDLQSERGITVCPCYCSSLKNHCYDPKILNTIDTPIFDIPPSAGSAGRDRIGSDHMITQNLVTGVRTYVHLTIYVIKLSNS